MFKACNVKRMSGLKSHKILELVVQLPRIIILLRLKDYFLQILIDVRIAFDTTV